MSVRGNTMIIKNDFLTYSKTGAAIDQSGLDSRMHYRRFYAQELEKIKELMPNPSPFHTYDIMRGRSRGFQNPFWKFKKNK
jgi:hypothetical protein